MRNARLYFRRVDDGRAGVLRHLVQGVHQSYHGARVNIIHPHHTLGVIEEVLQLGLAHRRDSAVEQSVPERLALLIELGSFLS